MRRASGRSPTTRAAKRHYDTISAWIKSTRAGDVQASVYYLAAMLEGGEDARFIARRMIVLASEDIGNADPRALLVAVAAAQAVEHVGLPEARLNLAQAAVYLARAPKSNASYRALARRDRRRPRAREPAPPDALRSAALSGRAQARPRRGLRLPARRPGGVRGRLPAGGAEGPRLLHPVRLGRGVTRDARGRRLSGRAARVRGSARRERSRRARPPARPSRSRGRGSG